MGVERAEVRQSRDRARQAPSDEPDPERRARDANEQARARVKARVEKAQERFEREVLPRARRDKATPLATGYRVLRRL